MRYIIVLCFILGSMCSWAQEPLRENIDGYIKRREEYEEKSAELVVKKYRINRTLPKRKYYYFAKVIPTFESDNVNINTIDDYLETLRLTEDGIIGFVLLNTSWKKSLYTVSSLSYIIYDNYCYFVGNWNPNAPYNDFVNAYFDLGNSKPPTPRFYEFDLVFRVKGYEDYWFMLKDDVLRLYSLSTKTLYEDKESVLRIIQTKKAE